MRGAGPVAGVLSFAQGSPGLARGVHPYEASSAPVPARRLRRMFQLCTAQVGAEGRESSGTPIMPRTGPACLRRA